MYPPRGFTHATTTAKKATIWIQPPRFTETSPASEGPRTNTRAREARPLLRRNREWACELLLEARLEPRAEPNEPEGQSEQGESECEVNEVHGHRRGMGDVEPKT